MFKKIGVLVLVLIFVLCFCSAGFTATQSWIWGSHNSLSVMDGNKSVSSNGKFDYLTIVPNIMWTTEDTLDAPLEGTLKVPGPFILSSWGDITREEYKEAVEHTLKIGRWRVFGTQGGTRAEYQPIIETSGVTENAVFIDCEESFQGQTVSLAFEGLPELTKTRTLQYKTTEAQLKELKAIPYFELKVDENGFVAEGVARLVDPETQKTLIMGQDLDSFYGFYDFLVTFSTDGTRNNTQDVSFIFEAWPETGLQEISFDVSLPEGLEGVIHEDMVTQTTLGWNYDDRNWGYMWKFFNTDNIKKLPLILGNEKAPDGTEIVFADVDLSSTDYTIPDTDTIKVDKAGDGTVAVQTAMGNELEKDGVNLVKAAEFVASYTGPQNGKQVLPTTMKFNATREEIGETVWKIISDDSKPETVLKHLRVRKIIPIPATNGTAVSDLLGIVPELDWDKVFSASLDNENEEVNITANLMIVDAADTTGQANFDEGVKTFGSVSYLMYVDGVMNGKFEDPIALVSYEVEPVNQNPNPLPKPNPSSSGGCNILSGVMLLAVPLVALQKRKR